MKTKFRKLKLVEKAKGGILLLFFALMSGLVYGQQVQVSGTVTDNGNLPLIGVTIVESGTTNGVVTNIDGNYTITVKSSSSSLKFSYIGFKTSEVVVGAQSRIDMVMNEDLAQLDEVIVTGYGVQKKSDLTGAVSSVSGDNIRRVPIATIDQALQGQAAGVYITSKSGRPGEAADIQIRGMSSINGTQPLVVIDGVPGGDMNSINPNDIASIEVLKDASSAAIYGATGGNGVIMITTKQGEAGKIKTNVNIYRGVESSVGYLDLMNSQEWMQLQEESRWNADKIGSTGKNRLLESTLKLDPMYTYRPDTLKSYNWQDEVLGQAISENYDISISGGNESSKILVSASYNKQEGIIKASGYERFTFRINSEQKLSKRIIFDQKINITNTVHEGLEDWRWHQYYDNPIYNTMLMDPSAAPYDANGAWTQSFFSNINPLVDLDMKDRTQKNVNLNGNFGLNVNIVKGLTYTARFSGTMGFGDFREYEGIYFATATNNRPTDKLIREMDRSFTYNIQNLLTYNTSIAGSHNISVMAGMEAAKWWGYNMRGVRVDMASNDPNMLYFDKSTNASDDQQNVTGSGFNSATMAYFGRVNYDYNGRYLMTFNIRRDGSSSFGPANRFGIFPSLSAGWKFSEENFMQDVDVISFGKIRFGYGETGTNARSGFPYLSQIETPMGFRYSVDNITGLNGAGPIQIANPEIHWETVTMSNLGLDLTFFENRLSFTADLFDKVNEGMLMYQEVPNIAGSFNGSNPEVNVGSISNMGYEITIGARKSEGELKGSINLNFSGVKNKVLELAKDSMTAGRVHELTPTNITMVGAPIGQFYGYETEGIFTMDDPYEGEGRNFVFTNQPYADVNGVKKYAQPGAYFGDVRYKDQNKDGKINEQDKVILGSPLPKLTYGFSINLEYKGFDFSAFFNGTYGNKILNGQKQYTYYLQGNGNAQKAFTDRFVPFDVYALDENGDSKLVVSANHDTELPRYNADNFNKLREWFIEDGSYLRLRNVVVGYTIPQNITSKIKVDKVRIYGGARNLFTLTKYTGLSPEVPAKDPEKNSTTALEKGVDLGVYPVTKMFYFGANITF